MGDVQRSKLLSLILRHDPAKAGLTLDDGGWVEVKALLAGLEGLGQPMSRDELTAIVAESDKKRFTLSPDGLNIRAAQGHSVAVELALQAKTPPERLFHGTAARFMDAIMSEGLRPMGRQQVHLSADTETAARVGQRHGSPVVLSVAADQMHRDGIPFFQADNGVWLADAVPPQYLSQDLDH
ncbi:RNA 2'-phosphotransferase [Brevundimonas sp.]|uniref:RNA 2'-phosphotransferase n=1 Tax=Brevundimonas sp. TaxID=1871086 RepID=UPI0035B398BE